MTDLEAIKIAEATVLNRNYDRYTPHYRDITLRPKEIRRIGAPDEHYMLRQIEDGLVIESENGTYDKRSADVSESAHAFTGQITIQNTTDLIRNVQFLQVIYVPKAVTPGVTPP